MITEIETTRMEKLISTNDREISMINKQVHEQIRKRKKKAQLTCNDKEEYQRISREIEKECIFAVVTENSKVRDLFKCKEQNVRNIIEKATNNLNIFVEKVTVL
jgi:ABC-type phosphate transport system auxiliary subunit